ncbi:hypothetical protein GGI15_000163 [Coemansia interrupta]|uniref:tRNA-uridine aminocarboxypropyltransferase 1 n=1 Tax=Coemansia interrupta TaxID=1126814 RepID=A0A9W8HMJ5_9FUNG|nr:hypothetical protein GGI15_000163 [Coemansia interrupta]
MGGAEAYDIDGLQVEPRAVLDGCGERVACGRCGKKVRYFCYVCCEPVGALSGKIPQLRLPFKLDILKHAGELDGKSTAVHAKLIAPSDTRLTTYTEASLADVDLSRTLLLFPGPDARDISEVDRGSFDRVVVIDGTWRQAKGMVRLDAGLRTLRKVTVHPRKTRFWRYQSLDDSFMATIEAIYFLYRDTVGPGYAGEYDGLMFFYKYFYQMIQSEYAAQPDRPFTWRQREQYIDYGRAEEKKEGGAGRAPKRDTRAKVDYEFADDLALDAVFDEDAA